MQLDLELISLEEFRGLLQLPDEKAYKGAIVILERISSNLQAIKEETEKALTQDPRAVVVFLDTPGGPLAWAQATKKVLEDLHDALGKMGSGLSIIQAACGTDTELFLKKMRVSNLVKGIKQIIGVDMKYLEKFEPEQYVKSSRETAHRLRSDIALIEQNKYIFSEVQKERSSNYIATCLTQKSVFEKDNKRIRIEHEIIKGILLNHPNEPHWQRREEQYSELLCHFSDVLSSLEKLSELNVKYLVSTEFNVNHQAGPPSPSPSI